MSCPHYEELIEGRHCEERRDVAISLFLVPHHEIASFIYS